MKTRLSRLLLALLILSGLRAAAVTRYVDLNSPSPTPPYINWSIAATKIQEAVDAAVPGDRILVTNGVYQIGSAVSSDGASNRVILLSALTLQSVNGPEATVIDGNQSVRCVYLANGAVLAGFTITNGFVKNGDGGGVLCASTNALVANCLVVSNHASYGGGVANGSVSNCVISYNYSSGSGGGARSCALYKCTLSQNSAGAFGGGASGGISSLNRCLVFANSAFDGGGGVFGSVMDNCIVVSNKASSIGGATADCILRNCTVIGNSPLGVVSRGPGIPMNYNCIIFYNSGGNFTSDVKMNNCCTTPLPSVIQGPGNFIEPPLFMNLSAGNFQLQSNSPCINAGKNSFVLVDSDYGNNPRIMGGTVDVGAFEYQMPASVLSYAWLQRYGLPIDGSIDFADPDADGMNNYGECRADTNPTNALSVLRMVSVIASSSATTVTWQSVGTRNFGLNARAISTARCPSKPLLQTFSRLAGRKLTQTGPRPTAGHTSIASACSEGARLCQRPAAAGWHADMLQLVLRTQTTDALQQQKKRADVSASAL